MRRLAKKDGIRFDRGSLLLRRQPQTMSRSSASSLATRAGMSAGAVCRAPSRVHTDEAGRELAVQVAEVVGCVVQGNDHGDVWMRALGHVRGQYPRRAG